MEKSQHKERREALKALSKVVKPLVKSGQYETVNEAVIEMFYRQDGHQEFNTLWEWNKKGYRVKSGSRAFAVWATPKKLNRVEQQEQDEDKKMDFYPICYLFSNLQVNQQSERRAA
ncbi:MAG: hypothetical protein FD170_3372 [Bacteroidetes bacterium]|jgi:hypothetical protein|nr:MAG: hypothetical protein FD170_3372 [Bacteroidota bacterium]